jgi:hypothetical protein
MGLFGAALFCPCDVFWARDIAKSTIILRLSDYIDTERENEASPKKLRVNLLFMSPHIILIILLRT